MNLAPLEDRQLLRLRYVGIMRRRQRDDRVRICQIVRIIDSVTVALKESVCRVMKKEEYANLELDELIPMVLEIFAQIDVQTI